MELEAFVDWPEAPLTRVLVVRALQQLSLLRPALVSKCLSCASDDQPVLQWATYDAIDHALTLSKPSSVLASSFTIRKALIRKHFLHRCILGHTTKHPESSLLQHVPRTWDIEISFADELDELWGDELWDLAEELEKGIDKWWILKPGMADRGMGIRLFNTKEALQRIFEGFEEESDDDDENGMEGVGGDTNIVTSQLRHFVIQEYLTTPVLLDPNQVRASPGESACPRGKLEGRKFHLRAYCVVSGALTVYLYPRVLALFSSKPYSKPSDVSDYPEDLDLRPHLTNTCLQGDAGEANVRLLYELIGFSVLSGDDSDHRGPVNENDVASITDQMSDALSETFKAALQMPVHFQVVQPLPNAFELYGVDFLVGHSPPGVASGRFQVKLLEFNSEPAIEMTGIRLQWILEDLFVLIGKTCVEPFFSTEEKTDETSGSEAESGCTLRKCLEVKLRG